MNEYFVVSGIIFLSISSSKKISIALSAAQQNDRDKVDDQGESYEKSIYSK